jgi:CMP-N-acetylneuraminic acid synthetase
MKNIDDVCVIIQARLGSQRVPQKMIRPFAGTTLTDIALDKILQCKSFSQEQFYLSAWEPELRAIANNKGLNVFKRSEKSANSEGTPMTDMYEWWDKVPYKYAVLINGCTPFIKPETIDSFVEQYLQTDSDGFFGVMEKKNYFWNKELSMVTPWPEGQAVMNTKFVETTFEAAHCLYAGRLDKIGQSIWMGDFNTPGDIQLFPMNEEECLDIDYEWQFNMCEKLYISGVR